MQGFGLLLGHLVGDYIMQNDWMAVNKTNPLAGNKPFDEPAWSLDCAADDREAFKAAMIERNSKMAVYQEWWYKQQNSKTGHTACTVHCLLYTLSVWAFSFWWMPWWGLLTCFVVHWPIDRFRLARKWMENVSGQHAFANGVFSPWSIIVVDNIFHLLTLWVIAILAAL